MNSERHKIWAKGADGLEEMRLIDRVNGLDFSSGVLTQEERKEIASFCNICDYGPLGIDNCPVQESQVRYVGKGGEDIHQ
jgi:hypothetical protein